MIFSAQQCRMARAALELGVRDLAEIADVSPNTIARLERGDRLHPRTLAHVKGALESQGAAFIAPGAHSAQGGEGVRLCNTDQKSNFGRLFDAILNLPDGRARPDAAYNALLVVLGQYLDIVDGEGREPDAWERVDLNGALNALNRSNVFYAAAHLRRAITPPDNQSPDYPISTKDAAATATLDLRYFRRCVLALQSRGYQDKPD